MHFAIALFAWFPHGGMQRDCLDVAARLKDRGHRVTMLTRGWRGTRPDGIDVVELPARAVTNHGRNAAFARACAKAIGKLRPDYVLGFDRMPGLDAYFAADRCFAARAAARGPLYRLTPRARAMLAMERAVFRAETPTEILLLVEREKAEIQRHYGTPNARFHLIPPILSPGCRRPAEAAARALRAATRRALKLSDRAVALLFVASRFRTKGLDRALAAVGALPGPLRDRTRLLVAGGDDAAPYRRRTGSRWTTFLGARDDLPALMLAADLLVHPAREENAGKVLLEALAMGLPVLSSGICGYAEHVERAGAGQVLAEPFRQDALDRALADMVTRSPAADWSANGVAYARHTRGFGAGIDEVVATVERLAAGRRR